MNPLELRKIIVVGYNFAAPNGAPLLGADSLPVAQQKQAFNVRAVFWVPARKPHQRCAGTTETIDARAFELQALRDGAVVEVAQDFAFPEQPSLDEMRRRLMPVWEGLTVASLGALPNGAPEDHDPQFKVQFTAVTQPL